MLDRGIGHISVIISELKQLESSGGGIFTFEICRPLDAFSSRTTGRTGSAETPSRAIVLSIASNITSWIEAGLGGNV